MKLGETFLSLLENHPGRSSGEPCVLIGGGIVGGETSAHPRSVTDPGFEGWWRDLSPPQVCDRP